MIHNRRTIRFDDKGLNAYFHGMWWESRSIKLFINKAVSKNVGTAKWLAILLHSRFLVNGLVVSQPVLRESALKKIRWLFMVDAYRHKHSVGFHWLVAGVHGRRCPDLPKWSGWPARPSGGSGMALPLLCYENNSQLWSLRKDVVVAATPPPCWVESHEQTISSNAMDGWRRRLWPSAFSPFTQILRSRWIATAGQASCQSRWGLPRLPLPVFFWPQLLVLLFFVYVTSTWIHLKRWSSQEIHNRSFVRLRDTDGHRPNSTLFEVFFSTIIGRIRSWNIFAICWLCLWLHFCVQSYHVLPSTFHIFPPCFCCLSEECSWVLVPYFPLLSPIAYTFPIAYLCSGVPVWVPCDPPGVCPVSQAGVANHGPRCTERVCPMHMCPWCRGGMQDTCVLYTCIM